MLVDPRQPKKSAGLPLLGTPCSRKIMTSQNELIFDPQLIRRFDINGPRYTSYPTADRFVEAFNADCHGDAAEGMRQFDHLGADLSPVGLLRRAIDKGQPLPPEVIAFEGMGDTKPVASNASETGRARNRRVEVEVWYDEPKAATMEQEVLVKEDFRQIKVCRVQELCLMRFQDGHAKRTRVNAAVFLTMVSPEFQVQK